MTNDEKPLRKITEAEVRQVARLARLNLSASDLPVFVEQLGNILGYVDKLNQVTTGSIAPTAQAVPLANVFRDDLPEERTDSKASLANAPVRHEGMFEVPGIID